MNEPSQRWHRWKELDRNVDMGDLNDEVAMLRKEIFQSIPLHISMAWTITGLLFVGICAGFIVSIKDPDPLRIYDYLAYACPLLAAWSVALGLYQRMWIFRAFHIGVGLLLGGLIFHFLSHRMLSIFLTQWIGWIAPVTSLLLVVLRRKENLPEKTEGIQVFYGVLLVLSVTLWLLWLVITLPGINWAH